MAINKNNRLDPNGEKVKSRPSSNKKRSSQYKTSSDYSVPDPSRYAGSGQNFRYSSDTDSKSRYTSDTEPKFRYSSDTEPKFRYTVDTEQNDRYRTTTGSDFNTDRLSRTLEEQADSHVRKARRDVRYSTGPLPTEEINDSRRVSKKNTKARKRPAGDEYGSAEDMYRARKLQRQEAARWKRAHWTVRSLIVLILILDIIVLRFGVFRGGFLPVWNVLTSGGKGETAVEQPVENTLPINEQLLTVNEYSRPGTKLDTVNGLVIHYIGNPGTDAQMNRDYFENLQDGSTGVYASCNYIIGLDGTIIQCVPDDEVAYASGERNNDTISIECCHPDESGAFTQETFQSLVQLTAKLCKDYNLSTDQVLRHYDVNQKPCPKFFVDDPDAWTNFISSVNSLM